MTILSGRQKIHHSIFIYGLILIVLTLPFSFAANSISIMLVTANWIAEGNYSEKFKLLKNNFLLFLLAAFFLLHLTGLIYTSNFSFALIELQKKIPVFVLPFIISTSGKINEGEIKKILKAFLFSCFIASVICIGYAAYRTDIVHTYDHPNWLLFSYRDLTMIIKIQATYLAIYICFCLISLQYFLFLNYKFYSVLKKITFIFLICYFIFFLSLLASRTAIAAFILISFSGIIYHFYSIKKVFTGIGILGISSALLVTIFLQNPFIKERILHAFGAEQQLNWINQYGDGHSNPAEDRKIMWKSVWNAGKENWIFGVGTGDTEEKLLEEYSKVNFKAGIDAQYNAHSQFLQTWFELGLIGLIAFISCLIYPAIHAIKEKNVLCLSFLSLVFISCITEAMLERQHGIVFFSLFISLFGFHSLHTKENFK